MGVGLRRTSFDEVMERVLPLIRIGQIGVVQHHHGSGQGQSRKQQRYCQTVQTDATSLDRHDFIVFAHDSQRHQDGDQRPQRCQLVEQIGSKVAEIIHHNQKGNSVARNVVEYFEEGEGLKKKDKHPHQQRKIIKETPQNIDV